MKPATNFLRFLNRLSPRLKALLWLWAGLPLLLVCGFGLYAIVMLGYALPFIAACAVSVTIFALVRLAAKQQLALQGEALSQGILVAKAEWSDFDQQIWQQSGKVIHERLGQDAAWAQLQNHTLELVALVANHYGKRKLDISPLEALKLLEEISRRYRHTLSNHLPFAEKLKLQHLKFLFDNQENLAKAQQVGEQALNLYRAARMLNPATALLAEARGYLFGKLFDGVSDELQLRLKSTLLQEVAGLAIDLYSGRFKFDLLLSSATLAEDNQRLALPLEPIRIALIGQVSSGKSTLINSLMGEMVAEVNQLPSTDAVTVYRCQLGEGVEVHLVDLPGLDGSEATNELLLKESTRADLVVWTLKANQSARESDCAFMQRFQAFFAKAEQQTRQAPPLLGVLTHIDRLKGCANLWEEPLLFGNQDDSRVQLLGAALAHNRNLLAVSEMIPLALKEGNAPINFAALEQAIGAQLERALNAQLSRRRHEANGVLLGEQLQRAQKLLKSLFKLRA